MNRENKNIDDMLFNSLENFEVNPSLDLKKRIDKSMFFVNLIRYHLGALIAGFSGVVAITGLIIYFNMNTDSIGENTIQSQLPNNTENNIANQKQNDNNKPLISNETVHATTNNKLNVTENKISSISKNETAPNIIKNNTKNDNQNSQLIAANPTNKNIASNTKNKKSEVVTESQKVEKNIPNKVLEKNNTTEISENKTNPDLIVKNTISEKNQITENKNPKSNIPLKEAINQQNNPEFSAKSSSTQNPVSQENNSLASGYSEKTTESGIINQAMNHLFGKIPKLPLDTNSTPYDTVTNFKGEPIIIKSKFYAVDIFWSGFTHQSNFSNVNSENVQLADQRKNAVQPVLGYESFGMNMSMNYKHLLLQTGIGFTKITDDFTYQNFLTNPNQKYFFSPNSNPYNYFNNGNYFQIDTIGGYWHYTYALDSMIHVKDSAWVHLTDTTKINHLDSTLKTVYDTLKNKKIRNTYSYFEIPLVIGYEMSFKNFDFALKGGIITSILTNTSGNNTTKNTGELEPIQTIVPFRKFIFSGIISISANYNLTENWGIYAEPYYRHGFSSLLSKNTILNLNNTLWGVRFGMRYKF